jgi:hypothetical protein
MGDYKLDYDYRIKAYDEIAIAKLTEENRKLIEERQRWYKFARWVGEVYPDAKKQYEAIMDIERSLGNE